MGRLDNKNKSKINPSDYKLKDNNTSNYVEDTIKPPSIDTQKEVMTKRKVGRPKVKTEECRTINIAVPLSILEKLDTVKICYNSNLTQYINKLIEKDIKANYEDYKRISDSLNSLK